MAAHKFEGSQAVYQHNTREKAKLISGREKALPLEDLYPRLVYIVTGNRGQLLQFLTLVLSFTVQFHSHYSLSRHLLSTHYVPGTIPRAERYEQRKQFLSCQGSKSSRFCVQR